MVSGQGRYTRSTGGMLGAMIVSLGVILGFVAFRALVREDVATTPEPVEYAQPAQLAQESAEFEILTPEQPPEGWTVTSVRFTPSSHWHLGLLTDEDSYVGLEQGTSSVRTMVQEYVDEQAVAGEPVTIDGQTWRTWTDGGGDTALVRKQDGATTLVVGTTSREDLVGFIETLR